MKIGLTGKSFCGKSTIFNSLLQLKSDSGDGRGKRIGTISVPDERIDYLVSVFKPKKTAYANIQIEEMEGSFESSKDLPNLISSLRQPEALSLVLDAFSSDAPAPLADLRLHLDELKIADLLLVEKRIDRLKREGVGNSAEVQTLEKIKHHLEENDALIRTMALSEDEKAPFSGFKFLTDKPILVLVNQSESRFRKTRYEDLEAFASSNGIGLMEMCAPLEWELSQLAADDQKDFLQDLGIDHPATHRFIQTCYSMVDYISFFTVGPDEVKAWPIARGTPAVKAAGKIHSDIERGFIRAEVIGYSDFLECGSEAEAKARGKAPLEGKTYAVRDGDIVHFKFNV